MKSLKKILSIFAAFMMVVGLTAANVKAADNGTITVDNADQDATYQLYKVFSAEIANESANANNASGTSYYMTVDGDTDAKISLINSSNVLETKGSVVNGKIMVTAKNGVSGEEIATWLNTDNHLSNIGGKAIGNPQSVGTDKLVTWTGLEYGYYMVKNTANNKSVVTLTSANPSQIIKDKNTNGPEIPGNAKKVLDPATNQYVTITSDKIGTQFTYQVSFKARNHSTDENKNTVEIEKYTISDNPTGIQITSAPTVTVDGTSVVVENLQQDLTQGNGNFTFDLTWKDENGFKYNSPAEVVITYTGKLTSLTGTNTANIKYNDTTKSSTVVVNTANAKVLKTGENDVALTGAQFELYETNTNGTLSSPVNVTLENGIYTVDPTSGSNIIETSGNDGSATVHGLKTNCTYYLKEIKAPEGYTLPNEGTVFELKTGDKDTTTNTTVENSKGSQLPSTGGMGTTMIYIAGAILMVGAAIIFVTNKRMKHE